MVRENEPIATKSTSEGVTFLFPALEVSPFTQSPRLTRPHKCAILAFIKKAIAA
jgi:hypothetical protein